MDRRRTTSTRTQAIRQRARVVTAIAVALAASGCGSASRPAAAPPPSTTTAPPSTAAPAITPATSLPSSTTPPTATTVPETTVPATQAPSSTTPSTEVAAPPVACTSAQLSVSQGRGGVGLGHVGIALLFHNRGPTTCTLRGYPGVALLDASGQQVVQAARTPSGYLGGLPEGSTTPPVVAVPPGGDASALLEGTDVPPNGATKCAEYPALLVTPPNHTVSVSVRLVASPAGTTAAFPGCSTPEIHPVVTGTTGGQN